MRTSPAHPLLSAFPLTVMLVGTLLIIFALIMTLSADADGAVPTSTSISRVATSAATGPLSMRVY